MLTVDLYQGPGDGTLLGEDEDGLFVYVTYLRKLYLVAGSSKEPEGVGNTTSLGCLSLVMKPGAAFGQADLGHRRERQDWH